MSLRETLTVTAWGLALAAVPGARAATNDGPPPGPARLEALVEANITGVHAYQMLLARKEPKSDPACWPAAAPDAVLEALGAHQTALLSESPATVKAWAAGETSPFDPAKDLKPLLSAGLPMPAALPVNVYTAYLAAAAPGRPRAHVRAIANLYQTVLEVERDGDRLQDLFAFYIGLGLPVYVGQVGLPGRDEDFLAVGRGLEGKSCASPVGLTAAEWQIAGRKIWNWGKRTSTSATRGSWPGSSSPRPTWRRSSRG